MAIPVNYTITKTVPAKQSDSWFENFAPAWNVDIEAIRLRLQAIGYTCAVSRELPDKITVNFNGVPNYFANGLRNINDWRVQAELDVESALKLQQAGLLNTTYMATPITPITQSQAGQAINVGAVATEQGLEQTLQYIQQNLPSPQSAGTVLGLTTPVIIAGLAITALILLRK